MDAQEAHRLRADIALRGGEYARAAEHLVRLGATRALAFAADRAGDHALAARTLEALGILVGIATPPIFAFLTANGLRPRE